LGIPCLTFKDSTERPEAVVSRIKELVGINPRNLAPHLANIASGKWKKGSIPYLCSRYSPFINIINSVLLLLIDLIYDTIQKIISQLKILSFPPRCVDNFHNG
jgi:hypothetical protein